MVRIQRVTYPKREERSDYNPYGLVDMTINGLAVQGRPIAYDSAPSGPNTTRKQA